MIRVEVRRAGAQRDTAVCSQPSLWNQTINEDFSPSRLVAGQKDQCVRFTVVCWEKLDLSYAYYHVYTLSNTRACVGFIGLLPWRLPRFYQSPERPNINLTYPKLGSLTILSHLISLLFLLQYRNESRNLRVSRLTNLSTFTRTQSQCNLSRKFKLELCFLLSSTFSMVYTTQTDTLGL